MGEVAASLGLSWQGPDDATVRLGGPVAPVRGWILHDTPDWDPTAREVLPGVWLTTSLEPATRAGRREIGCDGASFLLLLGYAGWGGSQLESEIAAGSWVAVPIVAGGEDEDSRGVDPRWLFDTDPADMWDSALHAIGVDPARLVGLKGGDLSLH
jgi:putative transcriptional regulator